MDDLPAIIHRLSLRLWVPEYRAKDDKEKACNAGIPAPEETPVDPLASPPQDPVDVSGNILDPSQIASLSLESGVETHSLFSQKNLVRLAALTDSHRTLSLFTPGMRDVVFRAWAGPVERGESHGVGHTFTPSISRSHSFAGNMSTTYTFSDDANAGPRAVRPTLTSYGSSATGLSLGSNRTAKPHGGRKRKHRVVNLRRKNPETGDLESVSGEGSTISGTASPAPSEYGPAEPHQEREGELTTPPKTPEKPQRPWQQSHADFDGIDLRDTPPRLRSITPRKPPWQDLDLTPRPASSAEPSSSAQQAPPLRPRLQDVQLSQRQSYPSEKAQPGSSTTPLHPSTTQPHTPFANSEAPSGGILEQAWMMKIAGEIARRVHDEKVSNQGLWDRSDRGSSPPPAYRS
jgi:distribution and morphology protein 34